ncbi:serine/threonine protein phosphatase 1 [Novosphingobium sp. PhB165]|uniref:metallophosphoesterase family protein n=1 Tax=Novosphingobium sp. PhB165 TaxID=2485105 RepID=UPI0010D49678|nr:metallophosphoesterase family protein [Novosphingobium sp. PhB165]TCM17956.1 serine/threonine protein phosphatase 1 [Novosphingobium sp. PhB165]
MIDVNSLPVGGSEQFTAVYAVGDIHGRLDLLDRMEALIASDITQHQPIHPLICYLGDYIDRGPQSAQVIDRLSGDFTDGIDRVFLKGNHEDRMLDFLDDPAKNGPSWLKFGGREALESYGLTVSEQPEESEWAYLREALRDALPPEHHSFLTALDLGFRWRDYLFVHAGLDPERPTTAQMPHDLMWIREPFLSSDHDWGFRVVHGHVIVDEPVFRADRIGIDTGAYQSGCLTCLVVTEDGLRLLQTQP